MKKMIGIYYFTSKITGIVLQNHKLKQVSLTTNLTLIACNLLYYIKKGLL